MMILEQAKNALDQALQTQQQVIVALEGGAASGKTTLAEQLADAYHAPVIHMDEFFLPFELRTPQRFAQPGGNIHYERFDAQVAAPLRAGSPFAYGIFDCSQGKITGEKHIGRERLILVEGVYSLHPLYSDIYDLRFFLKTAPETQDERLRARGEWLYQRFKKEWLPLEQAYFHAFQLEKQCDLRLAT